MHNKALIGIIIILLFFIINVVYIGNKNLWFERSNKYWTTLKSGEGLMDGTPVTFNGLKVGEVMSLGVTDDNSIKVRFTVKKSLAAKITRGSTIKVARSMMIGEKKLEILPGPKENAPLNNNDYIPGADMRELSDMLSGGDQLQRLMPQFERIINNVDIITTSFAEHPQMVDKLTKTLDEAYVLLRAMERSFIFKKSVNKIIDEDNAKK